VEHAHLAHDAALADLVDLRLPRGNALLQQHGVRLVVGLAEQQRHELDAEQDAGLADRELREQRLGFERCVHRDSFCRFGGWRWR